jgi:hypothetical protein
MVLPLQRIKNLIFKVKEPSVIKDWLRHLARIYMPVYQYESESMKITYAGYSPIKRNYYARLLLNSNSKLTFLGWYWFSRIPRLFDTMKIDMIVSEISRNTFTHFRNCNGYILPVWAAMRINIDRPAGEIFNKNRNVTNFKDVIRRIRKHNLTYEILSDKASFDYFNERFYKPFITKRHREEAFIEDLNLMWNSFEHPLMMAIREEGIIVGMSFIRISRDILYLMRVGLIDGNQEYSSHGVIGATYYFGILEGQKMGCKYVDLGGGRPFLTDRLTKYKAGLGAEFVMKLDPSKEYLWFGFNDQSSAAREFLQMNPFMYLNKDFMLEKYVT